MVLTAARTMLYISVRGWHNMPEDEDSSREAHIVRVKCFRNELCHRNSTAIPNDEFETVCGYVTIRDTQRLFSVNYLLGEANIA